MRKPTTKTKIGPGLRVGAGSLALAAFALSSAQAQTEIAFDGGTSNPGVWNDAVNWTGDVLPSAANNLTDIGTSASPAGGALVATADLSTSQTIGELRVGRGDNAVGTLNQSAGTLNSGGWAFVGYDGSPAAPTAGTVNLSGDAAWNNLSGPLLVGGGGGFRSAPNQNVGTIGISDTAQLNVDAFGVGGNDGNLGIVNQSSGSVTVNAWMNIGDTGGVQGEYNMTGGSLTLGTELSVGQGGLAQGTLSVSGSSVISGGSANVRFGRYDGSGVLNITGSSVAFDVAQLSLPATTEYSAALVPERSILPPTPAVSAQSP